MHNLQKHQTKDPSFLLTFRIKGPWAWRGGVLPKAAQLFNSFHHKHQVHEPYGYHTASKSRLL